MSSASVEETNRIADQVRQNAVTDDVAVEHRNDEPIVSFTIDAGFSPDGEARLSHVLKTSLEGENIVDLDAYPIDEHRLRVEVWI